MLNVSGYQQVLSKTILKKLESNASGTGIPVPSSLLGLRLK
jgi:hypothetical protein